MKNSAALLFCAYKGQWEENMWKKRRKFGRLDTAKLTPDGNTGALVSFCLPLYDTPTADSEKSRLRL